MRIAVVSDVHGSLTALRAVIRDLEHVGVNRIIHGGDLALNGPHPAEVTDEIRELGWPGVLGNTDELLWQPEQFEQQRARMPKLEPLLRVLFQDSAPATRALLGVERIEWLKRLPVELHDQELAVLHARPDDLWRAPMPDSDDDALHATYEPTGRSLIVYGHIHRPYVRQVDNLQVANSGSAGLTWDGDPRASYLLIEDGTPSIRRVEYEVAKDIADLKKVDYPHGEWLAKMKRLGSYVAPPEAKI